MPPKTDRENPLPEPPRRPSSVSRRTFLTSVAVGAGAGVGSWSAGISRPVRARRAPLCATSDKALLSPSDFRLLGYYDLKTNASNSFYAQGLTHRYVNG